MKQYGFNCQGQIRETIVPGMPDFEDMARHLKDRKKAEPSYSRRGWVRIVNKDMGTVEWRAWVPANGLLYQYSYTAPVSNSCWLEIHDIARQLLKMRYLLRKQIEQERKEKAKPSPSVEWNPVQKPPKPV